jgi:NADH:ubiquinone oxidoreductase subunit C
MKTKVKTSKKELNRNLNLLKNRNLYLFYLLFNLSHNNLSNNRNLNLLKNRNLNLFYLLFNLSHNNLLKNRNLNLFYLLFNLNPNLNPTLNPLHIIPHRSLFHLNFSFQMR